MPFALNPALDAEALAHAYARTGRVAIKNLLAEGCAEQLREHINGRQDWVTVLNAGEKVYEIGREGLAALTPGQRSQLDSAVAADARSGFQYRYETIRVPDAAQERALRDDLLTRFILFLSSPETLSFLGRVTGHADIAFADGQATAYSGGHFLTGHDDDVAGKNRRAAYVFGLTRGWRTEWGGLLLFHGADGKVEGHTPSFGTLRLFNVPALHSVSYVTPFAPEPRLSVTGWLRSRAP
jgi:SM-20-related protein